jgi:hypothetical protein
MIMADEARRSPLNRIAKYVIAPYNTIKPDVKKTAAAANPYVPIEDMANPTKKIGPVTPRTGPPRCPCKDIHGTTTMRNFRISVKLTCLSRHGKNNFSRSACIFTTKKPGTSFPVPGSPIAQQYRATRTNLIPYAASVKTKLARNSLICDRARTNNS